MKEHTTQSRTAYRSQLKEHKKLYKSGKNWMAATLLTVGLAGGAMLAGNTTANADALPAQSSEQTAQNVTDNSELSQTQADAQKQQQTIDNGNAQLDQQNQQLSDLQDQQSAAQQNLDQATGNNSEVQKAQADVNTAQQQVNNQKTKIAQDQQAVEQAQTGVQQAQETVKQGIEQSANQNATEAQNIIDQLENQGKTQASQELNNQINSVSGQVTNAQNDVNNTNSKISDLQGQVKELQNQQSSSQTDPNVKNFDGHVVDTSKSLLENASRNNLWDNYYDNTQDASTWNGNVIPQNIYVSPDNNKTEDHSSLGPAQPNLDYYNTLSKDVDVVNGQMTDAQKQELAILLMNEINHAREDRGLKPFTMTEQKYDQAQVRASQQSTQSLSHDMNDIKSAFGQDQYENLAYIPLNDTHSVYDLLNQASNTVSNMLNADASSDWGHRENFLWDTGDESYDAAFGMHLTDDGQYYVLTFDFDGPAHNNTPNMMDKINNYVAMGPITPSANTVDNSAKINDLNNQISNLKNTLNNEQSHLNDLQGQLQNLQAKKANIQFDLSQLTSDQQAEYNKAKDTLATLDAWKSSQLANINNDPSVKDAQKVLDNAKNVKAQDEAGLTELNQNLVAKQTALETARDHASSKAKELQAKLDNINGKISDLQNAIATTKATISQAQAQLAQDNKKIDELKNTTKPSTGDKGSETPSTPTTGKDGNKGSETPTQPTTPAKPDEGNKEHGTTPAEPSKPSKGDNKGTTTNPTEPSTPTKDDEHKGGETPTQPAQPTNPDTGNASISGQAGHKPAKSDSSETTTKPTIVLPESGSATNTQGQYVNVVSQPSVASQAGIQAPASMETTNVSFGTKMGEPMTREEYKAQQAKLPQTNDNAKQENVMAIAGLGILAATTFTAMVGATKRKHN